MPLWLLLFFLQQVARVDCSASVPQEWPVVIMSDVQAVDSGSNMLQGTIPKSSRRSSPVVALSPPSTQKGNGEGDTLYYGETPLETDRQHPLD